MLKVLRSPVVKKPLTQLFTKMFDYGTLLVVGFLSLLCLPHCGDRNCKQAYLIQKSDEASAVNLLVVPTLLCLWNEVTC